jgi:hypothetical protein
LLIKTFIVKNKLPIKFIEKLKTIYKNLSFSYSKTNSQKIFFPIFLLFRLKICPAMLNILSTAAGLAGIPKYLANLANKGNLY